MFSQWNSHNCKKFQNGTELEWDICRQTVHEREKEKKRRRCKEKKTEGALNEAFPDFGKLGNGKPSVMAPIKVPSKTTATTSTTTTTTMTMQRCARREKEREIRFYQSRYLLFRSFAPIQRPRSFYTILCLLRALSDLPTAVAMVIVHSNKKMRRVLQCNEEAMYLCHSSSVFLRLFRSRACRISRFHQLWTGSAREQWTGIST